MADKELTLEEQGLVGNSYDQIFSIDVRIRKIEDFTLPFRGGLAKAQIGTYILSFVVVFFFYALFIIPLLRIINFTMPWWLVLAIVFGLPAFASSRVVKPFKYGKTLNGTVLSFMRYHLDDPVHRRGVPVKTNPRDPDMEIEHYQREYVFAQEYADEIPGEKWYTDDITESRFSGNGSIDLSAFMDEMYLKHASEHLSLKEKSDKSAVQAHDRKGRVKTVIIDE